MKLTEIAQKPEEEKLINRFLGDNNIIATKNDDGTYNVDGDILLVDNKFEYFPIQFHKITGDFRCMNLRNLKSLKGAPQYVGGSVTIQQCLNLLTLEGGPVEVLDNYRIISNENLVSLKGAPKEINKFFRCHSNRSLKSLIGGPSIVNGSYNCSQNDSLETLEGSPKEIMGSFMCRNNNKLKTLKGSPKIIHGEADFTGCENLESLESNMTFVEDFMNVDGCTNLKSFKGLPDEVGAFFAGDNPKVRDYLSVFAIEAHQNFDFGNDKLTNIINKHYKDDQNVAACQEELIETGLGKYAEF